MRMSKGRTDLMNEAVEAAGAEPPSKASLRDVQVRTESADKPLAVVPLGKEEKLVVRNTCWFMGHAQGLKKAKLAEKEMRKEARKLLFDSPAK